MITVCGVDVFIQQTFLEPIQPHPPLRPCPMGTDSLRNNYNVARLVLRPRMLPGAAGRLRSLLIGPLAESEKPYREGKFELRL